MSRPVPPRLAALLVLAVLTGCATPAPPPRAVTPATLDSVVSVLPVWPTGPDVSDEVRKAQVEQPEGSGVAIFPGGYIATNLHVIRDATDVRVRLADGRVLSVEVVGHDTPSDLALLQAAYNLPVLRPAGPPALSDPVCAIGNQFGLGLSVTCGVVSAVHRTGTGFNPVEDFVQTDAAINPGASGGALVDATGRLVGLVSAIFSKDADANIGVNFATATPLVLRVAADLRDQGAVVRTTIGARLAPLSLDEQMKGAGARVANVLPGGPAADAGLQAGDIVTAIGDRRIDKPSDAVSAIALRRPGDRITIALRRAGKVLALDVTVAERPRR